LTVTAYLTLEIHPQMSQMTQIGEKKSAKSVKSADKFGILRCGATIHHHV
jgi:hypothetical protein